MQELWFLPSAHHLMLIHIYMKFREDRLNGFQVIERTQVRQTDRQVGLIRELQYDNLFTLDS